MSVDIKKLIQDWDYAKEYLESLGYTLGLYDFDKKKNAVLKNVDTYKGCQRVVGYIKVGDFSSLEITNEI